MAYLKFTLLLFEKSEISPRDALHLSRDDIRLTAIFHNTFRGGHYKF
jgi:hypothetical protein